MFVWVKSNQPIQSYNCLMNWPYYFPTFTSLSLGVWPTGHFALILNYQATNIQLQASELFRATKKPQEIEDRQNLNRVDQKLPGQTVSAEPQISVGDLGNIKEGTTSLDPQMEIQTANLYHMVQKSAEHKKKPQTIKRHKCSKNSTKNIPKNYANTIIVFAKKHQEIVKQILDQFPSVDFGDFMNYLYEKKDKINSISGLRSFWGDEDNPVLAKITRIVSNLFFRRHSYEYIFNSKVTDYSNHTKYRTRLVEALRNPEGFVSIKQY